MATKALSKYLNAFRRRWASIGLGASQEPNAGEAGGTVGRNAPILKPSVLSVCPTCLAFRLLRIFKFLCPME